MTIRPLILLIILGALLAGCEGDGREQPVAPDAVEPTTAVEQPTSEPIVAVPTRAATPTLAPAVATQAAITPSPSSTPSPSPTPTQTPPPATRLALGEAALTVEDFDAAVQHFEAALQAPDALDEEASLNARWRLGLAHLGDGRLDDAIAAFTDYLDTAETPDPAVYFPLGQAHAALGDCPAAIDAYLAYLAEEPETAAYVQPRIAACQLALGDADAAIGAYLAALDAPAHRLTRVDLHFALADLHINQSQFDDAVAQYDAIHDLAQTENTRGQVTYLAGRALAESGDETAAHTRYQTAVANYPRAYSSYLALVELVEAGVPVDPFQRGLVDYYAAAYGPAVDVFLSYLDGDKAIRPDAYLYLAWSYEGLGDAEAALAQIDAYAAAAPDDPVTAATALIRRAELLARLGRTEAAVASYDQFVADYPDHPQAPEMAYRAATLADETAAASTSDLGRRSGQAARFLALADAYPAADFVPEALFEAGLLWWEDGDQQTAVAAWERVADSYPASQWAAAALVWLMQHGPAESQADYREQAGALTGVDYYTLRAGDIADGRSPFEPPDRLDLTLPPDAQAEAEAWLRGWLGLPDTADVTALDPALIDGTRLRLGEKLWQIGLRNEAKRELEAVREAAGNEPLRSYQLALHFRDLGLYRSSILAAAAVLNASPDNIFSAPPFIGRLLYPVHYGDLILELAGQYGYNPLLQLALIRQESLFESFAVSSAAAKGLSQVIPDTGAYIAGRLDWPDYSDEHLYRPAVGLAFGAYYLDQQLDGFDGNVYAALSAYNGGPGNAARWLAAAPPGPDAYLETVDFAETRLYIQRIYVGHTVYQYLYSET